MSVAASDNTIVFSAGYASLPAGAAQEATAFSRREAVFAPRAAPPWLPATLRKLEDLATLEPNWDSYGATPVDVAAIERAQELICRLAQFVGVGEPAVGATPDGEPGLSWDVGAWSLDIDITPSGSLRYVYTNAHDASLDVEASTRRMDDLLSLLTAW